MSDVDQSNNIFGGTGSNSQVMQPGTNGEYIQFSMDDIMGPIIQHLILMIHMP